jgi:serine/threonine-protein kinase
VDDSGTLPKPGDVVDRYQILLEVGRGGMGVVYAVRRRALAIDKILAMKVLYPSLAGDEQPVAMFLDEARIASQVEHPNVVQVVDFGVHESCPFLIMEYLRGRPLRAVERAAKRRDRTLSTDFILSVLARAAEGLHAAHVATNSDGEPLGIVHRDVSPQNIHVGFDGDVKVVDFGIAAARGKLSVTRSGDIKGKHAYMAPEQITNDRGLDHRVDIWALGVVAWELLADQRLFRGSSEAATLWSVVHKAIPAISTLKRELRGPAADMLMACLERDPAKRPTSFAEPAAAWSEAAAALGGGRREDIARVMTELLAEDRIVERERLAAAQRTQPAPLVPALPGDATPENAEEADLGVISAKTVPDKAPRRVAVWALGIGVVMLAVGLFAMVRADSSETNAASADDAQAPSPSVQPSSSSAPTKRIKLEVGSDIRLVIVDGQRRDERPVEVELGASGRARLELVTVQGQLLERVITDADDGTTLTAGAPAPKLRPGSRPGGARPSGSAPGGTASSELLPSPYR